MIRAKPLTKKYLIQASRLGDSVFYYEEIPPNVEIGANLDPERLEKFKKTYDKAVSTESYVALDGEELVGIPGLYGLKEDADVAFWLGWFCVDSMHRGKGVGDLLLEYTIEEARKKGAKYLRLYTSTRPEEMAAQKLYEKKGFKLMKRNSKKDGQYKIVYREKVL